MLYLESADHNQLSQQDPNNSYGQQAMLISGSPAIATTTITQAALTPTPNIADAFNLHSKPGADKKIYLNFKGKTIPAGTGWARRYPITVPAWDYSGKPTEFDSIERSIIIQTWQGVSAAFSSFDIDVTTDEKTTSEDIIKAQSGGDTKYGAEVIMMSDNVMNLGGSIAYVGYLGEIWFEPAFITAKFSPNDEFLKNLTDQQRIDWISKYLFGASSHEVGHRLGLLHDGSSTTEYYIGHGSGETGWVPIMGDGIKKNIAQFSIGEYPDATNKQNDLMQIKVSNVNPRSDDYGNSKENPSSLVFSRNQDGSFNINTPGIIETKDDIDMFVIKTDYQGTIDLKAYPDAIGPTLDIEISLYDASGQLIKTNKPETTLSASLNYPNAAAGTYFVSIKNSGHTATGSDYGYSNYASLGQYRITGSYPLYTVHTPPKPIIDGSDLNGTPIKNSVLSGTAPFVVNFSSSSSSSDGAITNYYWDFGDQYYSTDKNLNNAVTSSPTHTFNTIGEYKVKLLTTTQYGITAQQVVTINVTRPANKTPIGLAGFEFYPNLTDSSSVSIQVYGMAREAPEYKFYEEFNDAYQFQTTGKVTKPDGTSEIITTTNDNAIVYTLKNKPAHGSLSFEVLDVAYTYQGKKVSTYIYDRTFNEEPLTKTFSW